MRTITSKFKIALVAVGLLTIGSMSAQTTNTATANTTQANKAGETIRLIDNKGTIKYLQSNNGITTITSTAAGNKTTTTWQLGGTLVENTDIDLAGKIFSLDQVLEVNPTTSTPTTGDIAATTTAPVAGTTTGWTLLVRDEFTGAIKKLKATDLIQSGITEYQAIAADETATTKNINVPKMPGDLSKVSVYRNGVKLRGSFDYKLTPAVPGGAAGIVTLTPQTTGVDEWAIYTGDIFEVLWIK